MNTRLRLVVIGVVLFLCTTVSMAQDSRTKLQNNTSGCDFDDLDFGAGYPCAGPFVGMFDNNPAGTNRLQGDGEYNAHVTRRDDFPVAPLRQMVSNLDIHNLLYNGNNTLIFAGYQPWFAVCHYTTEVQNGFTVQVSTDYPVPSSTATFPSGGYGVCNSHVENGYDATNGTEITQLANMVDRGFNGIIIDWYGQSHAHEDRVSKGISGWAATNYCTGISECTFFVALMEDQGSFVGTCPPASTTDQTDCIISSLNADFDYMNTNYFNATMLSNQNNAPANAYLRIAPNGPPAGIWEASATGRPAVFIFIAQSQWVYPANTLNAQGQNVGGQPNANWTTVWNSVRSHIASFGANEPYLIFELGNAFSHTLNPQSDGGFAWFGHWTNDSTNCSFTSASDPEGLCLLFHFYKSSLTATESWNSTLPMITVGSAWKGFDNTYAGWREFSPSNTAAASIMPQRCGQTWLDTFNRANTAFSTTKQLPFLQVSTWNDYDEGHEMETGIENCWTVNANLPVGSSVITWALQVASVQTNAASNATVNTIDHFEVWAVDHNSQNPVKSSAHLPVTSTSFDLNTLALPSSTYDIYVLEVSKPAIRNQASSPISYTVP